MIDLAKLDNAGIWTTHSLTSLGEHSLVGDKEKSPSTLTFGQA
jgi:hypothetical protein